MDPRDLVYRIEILQDPRGILSRASHTLLDTPDPESTCAERKEEEEEEEMKTIESSEAIAKPRRRSSRVVVTLKFKTRPPVDTSERYSRF